MIRRGFIIDLPDILRMRMLIMPCPWALFESKFCIECSICFSVNVIFDIDLWVLKYRKERISLPLSIIVHCLARKELSNSAYSIKLVTNLFSWKISGKQDIFYNHGKGLVQTNMFWDLWTIPLTFWINENNTSD